MRKEGYNFKIAKKGPVVKSPPGKTRITIRIDTDILKWFRDQAQKQGGGNYQTNINDALREYIRTQNRNLENTIRKVIREELKELTR
jgi:uncharacterized protein (DUF4415 family)